MAQAKGWNENLNLIIYFSIIASAIGIVWLALNDVPAGIRYITIFLASIAMLVVSFFFIREDQQEMVKRLMRNPFSTDYDVASGMYILGWILPILLSWILSFFRFRFNISQLMIPLSATDINENIVAQSFTIAQAQADPFWQWFITVFTAGTIEEWTFGFVLMLVGVLIGMMLWRLWRGDQDTSSQTAKNFYLIVGIIFTALTFAGAHKLNASYAGIMFLIATLFRVAMNWGIYFWGIFLSFTMGYHQSNNAVWFWAEYGPTATFKALLSPGGIIIFVYFAIIIFFAVRRIDPLRKKITKLFRSGG